MQNRDRKTKEITQGIQKFKWFFLSLHLQAVSRRKVTNKKGDYNSSTLTKPKTQIQLKSYLTHNRETYSRISKSCGTYSLFLKVQLSHNNINIYTPNNKLARAARETPNPNRNRC